MPTALESKAALVAVSATAVEMAGEVLYGLNGSPEVRRAGLLEAVPEVIDYFTAGTSALAVDYYADERDTARARGRFIVEPVVLDRTVKIRRAIAWSALPLIEEIDGAEDATRKRLAEVVQIEVARPYRDTITTNRQRDPEAVGWRRVTTGGCRFCRMLADKGAIFRESTVRFAAHEHCGCGVQPVFRSNDTGETASVMQHVASKRKRTPAEKQALREYLDAVYGAD